MAPDYTLDSRLETADFNGAFGDDNALRTIRQAIV
jgi:hypothetical protein